MKSILICLTVLLVTISQTALAQNNPTRLKTLSEKLNQSFTNAHQKALDMARQKNWPIKKRLENGAVAELIRLAPNGMPLYYITNNFNAAKTVSTNQIWPGGAMGLNLTGNGMLVGEWDEAGVRMTHQEFDGRVTQQDSVDGLSNHSTHVAGTLIAAGFEANAQGMAYEAHLDAYDWNNDESEMADAAANGLLISNHSYGYVTGWYWNWFNDNRWTWFGDTTISSREDYNFGFYSAHTQEWDQVAYDAPNYLIVVAAGNERDDNGPAAGEEHWIWDSGVGDWVLATSGRDPDGQYDCISFAALAKDVLTVGAVDDITAGYSTPSDVVISSFSSWGPADDGRIKPDIVANGVSLYSATATNDDAYASYSGTSMATPNTTGSLLLLQQYYQQTHHDSIMRAATLKALVIHTADEAGDNEGPDYAYGWGLLNTAKAAQTIQQDGTDAQIIEESLSNGSSYSYQLSLADNSNLTATLVWNDPPATPVAPAVDPNDIMLLNDLDLRITKDGHTYYPYVLDRDNPSQAATTGDNIVDNVEKIFLENPGSGIYTVTVNHKNTLQDGSQEFSLIISGHTSTSSKPSPINIVAGDGFDSMVALTWDPDSSVSTAQQNSKKSPGFLYGRSYQEIQNKTASTDTVSYYKVYRSTSAGGPYSLVSEIHCQNRNYGDNEDYIDHDVLNGTTYYYVITAIYTDGQESDYSAEVSARPQAGGYHAVINYVQTVPTLDGTLDAGEWDDAKAFDITAPDVAQTVTMYLKNDQNYLYVAVDDPNNTTTTDFNEIGLYFDDDNNNTWDLDTYTDEGNFWIDIQDGSINKRFRGIYGTYPDSVGFVSSVSNPAGVDAQISFSSGHIQYEIQIDLQSSVLAASPGDEIGFWLFDYDEASPAKKYYYYSGNGTWPYGAVWVAPENYGKIRLSNGVSNKPVPVNVVAGDGFDHMAPLSWDPDDSVTTLKAATKTENNNEHSAFLNNNIPSSTNSATDTVSYYKVYRSTTSGWPYTFLTDVHTENRSYGNNEDYIDHSAENGTTYFYVVTAVYTDGEESNYSAEVSSTPLANGYHATLNPLTTTPTIDGLLSASEWTDARSFNITSPGVSQNITLYLKNDEQYLYVAVDDPNNTTTSDYNSIGLYFDDDNNDTWDVDENTDEGNFWISYDNGSISIKFRGIYGAYPDSLHFVSAVSDPTGVKAGISANSGHLQYEVRIDLLSSVLSATPGDEIGFRMYNYDEGNLVSTFNGFPGNWPYGAIWVAPENYGKIRLAKGDTTSPPPVNIVAGNGFDQMVPLTWDPAENVITLKSNSKRSANNAISDTPQTSETVQATTEDTVSYYKIYRATQSGGPYTFLAEVHTDARNYGDNEDYIDQSVTNNKSYYYVVTAVYTNGNESAYSTEVSATPIDNGYHVAISASQSVPVLDGLIDSGEWSDATAFDITAPDVAQSVTMYLKNDKNYLYIAVDDPNNTTTSDFNEIGLYFDDDNNNTWDLDENTDEGNFWIDISNGSIYKRFRGIYGDYPDYVKFVSSKYNPTGVEAKISFSSGHIQYEIRIDLQSSVLSASSGDEIGFWLFNYDKENKLENYYGYTGNWPYGSIWAAPKSYGKIKLAEVSEINDIQLVSYTIDDDNIYQSVGNDDGQANPGEFLEIFLSVQNTSTVNSYHNMYIVPDSSFDAYVHPNPAYFFDTYLRINNIDPQQTVSNFDDLDFFVSSFTPDNYTLTIPLTFYDENDNIIGRDTLRIPVTGSDTQAPFLMDASASPSDSTPGTPVTVKAWVKEAAAVEQVMAYIQDPDGMYFRDLPLLATGTTDAFNGELFEGTFTKNNPADYVVDISAKDQFWNGNRFDNVTRFTQKPFEKQHDILLVADDYQWHSDFSAVYETALTANGLDYDIWRNWVRGPVDSTTLLEYTNGIVVWYCASHYPQADSLERECIAAYLDNGGQLFINDQDIGYYIFDYEGSDHGKNWYANYLHADYIKDNSRLYGVNGVADDSITNGLELKINSPYYYGGWWPSVIKPIEPATVIFNYDPADTVPGQNIYLNERFETIDDRTPATVRLVQTSMSTEDLGAGIKYAGENEKLVYLAFPFESIQDSVARKEVLYKILYWLNPQLITAVKDNKGLCPLSYHLGQNYPNPFNPETHISYSIPAQNHVSIQIYDVLGRLVSTLVDKQQKAGTYALKWNGHNRYGKSVASGVYILRMQAGNYVQSRKMIFMK